MSHYTVQGRRAEHKGLWKSCLACNPCAAQVPAHSQTWTGCHCLKETWRNDCCPCYSHKTSREGGIAQAPLSYSTWRLFCCTLLRETMKDCCCCFPRKPWNIGNQRACLPHSSVLELAKTNGYQTACCLCAKEVLFRTWQQHPCSALIRAARRRNGRGSSHTHANSPSS